MKDFRKILGREVDELNRTVFIIENMGGEQESVLYSELDMRKVRNESKRKEVTTTIIHRADGERIAIRSNDELGGVVDVATEKDMFLHPEKYEKKEKTIR